MEIKTSQKILQDFFEGKYSYNEYLLIRDWLNQSDGNAEITDNLIRQWHDLANSETAGDPSLQPIFEKIQYRILLEEKKKQNKKLFLRIYRYAAAILLLPVLMISIWLYYSGRYDQHAVNVTEQTQGWVEINAPEGARVQFLLPDSTTGWLNSGAKLRYPAVFTGDRKVDLTGEAYFDVKHLGHSEFMVSVADMDVKVLGTTFNVSAYPDDNFTDVVLKEGRVEITGKRGKFNYTLMPDEKITFNRDSLSLSVTTVNADRYSAWKDGYLIIENEPLKDVVGRIERWYNCEIEIATKDLGNYKFKATFKDEPIEEVLRLFARTTPMDYKIQTREFDSDGILKKKKVVMRMK
jgi:transmembrane sensor